MYTKCTQYVWSMRSYVTMSKQNWKCKHENGRFITRKLFESLKFGNFQKFSEIFWNYQKTKCGKQNDFSKSMIFLKRMIMSLVRSSESSTRWCCYLQKINPRRVEWCHRYWNNKIISKFFFFGDTMIYILPDSCRLSHLNVIIFGLLGTTCVRRHNFSAVGNIMINRSTYLSFLGSLDVRVRYVRVIYGPPMNINRPIHQLNITQSM